MVLCLVTLTDLYMRRAGLSASAEILVLHQMLFAQQTVYQRNSRRSKENTGVNHRACAAIALRAAVSKIDFIHKK